MVEHCLDRGDGKPCIYIEKANGEPICGYCLITGHARRVPIDQCQHYKEKTIKKYWADGTGIVSSKLLGGEKNE